MPFIRLPGIKGKVYVPEIDASQPRKHNCSDCFSCQMCGDDRCSICLKQKSACRNVCSISERKNPKPSD